MEFIPKKKKISNEVNIAISFNPQANLSLEKKNSSSQWQNYIYLIPFIVEKAQN